MKKFFLSLCVVAAMLMTACNQAPAEAPAAKANNIETILKNLHDPKSKQVLVVCHRGDWRNYPENSIPAIESVIKMGADMVEIDIQLTKDSVLVLSHDRTINRCTTGKGNINEMTYEEIQQYYLKTAHNVRSSLDLKMPTLEEALAVCKDRITVNLDKGYDYYDLVVEITEKLGVTDQVLIKGSKPVAEVQAKMAEHKNNLLYMPVITPTNEKHKALFDDYIAEKPQLAYEICFDEMNAEVESAVKRVLDSGSKLWVNTLWNSLCGGWSDDVAFETSAAEVYGKVVDMGTTIIQTDRPEMLIEYLRSRGLHD
ncbi:MAG: glycerophosphodiester phosphodiesterase family protein [Alistipes sp.]|nr:glycerophosphodiester phosphodiesterase family protein [Rikenellaceae bacterium]MBQ3213372.1 glycerophosphodiester phosphodiesterase family protein [Alistipes sp.]MBQ7963203.1 glycerophosphodiester phosphodiesterase family protein [Alistipes sp.]